MNKMANVARVYICTLYRTRATCAYRRASLLNVCETVLSGPIVWAPNAALKYEQTYSQFNQFCTICTSFFFFFKFTFVLFRSSMMMMMMVIGKKNQLAAPTTCCHISRQTAPASSTRFHSNTHDTCASTQARLK